MSKACTSEKIDSKGMDVAQPLWLSGCPTKAHFSAKDAFLVSLALKLPFHDGFCSRVGDIYTQKMNVQE